MVNYKSPREVESMRSACRVVAEALGEAAKAVRPGVTTGELDRIAAEAILERDAEILFKGYRGFPGNICVSVNDEIVHGIGDDRVLEEGDIVSMDCGARVDGWCGDSALTLPVGRVDDTAVHLMEVCRESLHRAVAKCVPGNRLSDIARTVQEYVEGEVGYHLVRGYTGHGIGRELHEDPTVPNYWDDSMRGHDRELKPGLVIAIEPMVMLGDTVTKTLSDRWTVVTRDGSLSAHYEHTVAITPDGPEILTSRSGEPESLAPWREDG